MKIEYKKWIMENYPNPNKATSIEAVQTMKKEFSELKIIRGQVLVLEIYDSPPIRVFHCWCETPEGELVDPTAHQFPIPILSYEPLDESRGDPTGGCLYCGGFCYDNENVCSEKCSRDFKDYLEIEEMKEEIELMKKN